MFSLKILIGLFLMKSYKVNKQDVPMFKICQIIIVTLSLSTAIAAEDKKSYAEFLKDSRVQLTQNEVTVSNHITNLFDLAEKNFINGTLVTKTLNEIKKHKVFSSYENWARTLLEINQASSIEKVINICSNQKELTVLDLNIKKVCLLTFIDKFKVNKNLSLKEEITFLKQNIESFLKIIEEAKIISFLNEASKNKNIHEDASLIILEFYKTNKKSINAQLASSLYPSPELYEHIHLTGLNESLKNETFITELDYYISNLNKLIDSEADKNLIHNKALEILNFHELTKNIKNVDLSEKKIFNISKNLARKNYFVSSDVFFLNLISSKNIEIREDAYFEYLWSKQKQNQYKEALSFIEKNGLLEKFNELESPKLMYWISNLVSKVSGSKRSEELHETLIKKYPLSYYAILSTRFLKDTGSNRKTLYEIIEENSANKELVDLALLDQESFNAIKRFKMWSRFSNSKLKDFERNKLIESTDINFFLLYAHILRSEKDYISSFNEIYRGIYQNKIVLSHDILSILYPKPFWESVASNKSNIDPVLTMALIRQESGFNPEAKSRVGATGLMQLMPNTAKRFQKSVTSKNLENAFLNITIGTKYFRTLLKRYDDSIVHALSAYNAGETRVDRWKKDHFLNAETSFHLVEEIPYLETRKYVKLIFRNVFFYKFLDNPSLFTEKENLNSLFSEYLGYAN